MHNMNKGEVEMLTKKMLKDAAEGVALKYNMNKLEQTIRDLHLYNDVGWDEINDMFNFALTALREKAERKLDDNTIEAMRKQIEALQQENNGWQERYDELDAGHSRLFKDFCKLQQENKQLQTQATQMWEALRKARKVLYNLRMDDYPGFPAICEALTAIDKAIGGKEDV
jgi:chromosome segregation ATPase